MILRYHNHIQTRIIIMGSKSKGSFDFGQINHAADLIAQGKYQEAVKYLRRVTKTDGRKKQQKGTFGYYLQKFDRFLKTGETEFSIFVKGNGKLPFLAFSSLPGKNFCPGAGDCLDFCYSFKGWRMPAVFFRQAQNHILLQSEAGRDKIRKAMECIKPNKHRKQALTDVRLYVDGDFCSVDVVAFWMDAIRPYTETSFYGYSKSIPQILEYVSLGGKIPASYTLNLSSGGRHEDLYPEICEVRKEDGNLLVRGEFRALDIGHLYMKNFGKDEKRALRKAAQEDLKSRNPVYLDGEKAKIFICPGKCGSCTMVKNAQGEKLPSHACGDQVRFQNTLIVIPVH